VLTREQVRADWDGVRSESVLLAEAQLDQSAELEDRRQGVEQHVGL
jgi:hypothetical protein